MPEPYLPAITAFDDVDLCALVVGAAQQARNLDNTSAYRSLWHEIAVLCAEEIDRRRAVLAGMERDVAGLPQGPEIGAILEGKFEIPSGWVVE